MFLGGWMLIMEDGIVMQLALDIGTIDGRAMRNIAGCWGCCIMP